jgi:hypothetical protein
MPVLARALGVASAMGGLAVFGYIADNPTTLKVLSLPMTLLGAVSIAVGLKMANGGRP